MTDKTMVRVNQLEVAFMELKTDIKYIKTSQSQTQHEHKILNNSFHDFTDKIQEELDTKADQEDVNILYARFWKAATSIILLLLGVIGFLIKNNLDMQRLIGG